MSVVVRAPEIDYAKGEVQKGTYRFARLVQQTGGTTKTLSSTSTTDSVFEIPAKCWNPSMSYLHFDINLADPGDSTKYNHLWTLGAPWLERLEFRSRSGTKIIELNNANVYYRATAAYTKKLEDMLSADPVKADATTVASRTTSMNSMVCRNNAAVSSSAVASGNSACRLVNGVKVANSLSYTEPQYVAAGADTSISVIHVAIPLGEFKGTFFSEKQDCYFPEVMLLQLVWSQVNKLGFIDTAVATGGTITALDVNASISNLYLYQALEVDPLLCNQLINKVNSGKSQVIPYVYSYREQNTGSTYNRQLKFNQSHGKNLLRIMHCNVHATESDSTFAQLDNNTEGDGDGAEVISYHTNLNNLRLSEIEIYSGNAGDDYAVMRKMIDGSCVQDRSMFNHNRLIVDSFDGQRLCDTPDHDSLENGLPLSGVEQLWSLDQTNNGSITHVNYVFAVTQKQLVQSQGQIMVI